MRRRQKTPRTCGAAAFLCGLTLSVAALAQTQADLNQQAGTDYAAADKQLNAAYAKLMAKITPVGQTKLKQAELDWIRYRDDECAFETMGTEGGSIHGMVEIQCKTRLEQTRTKDLQAQLNCAEGDLSCGGQ